MSPQLRYRLLCIVLGVVLGWGPYLVHGPIPQKFNVLYVDGQIAVWAFYVARMLPGFLVGATDWPRAWYVRGPLLGFLCLLSPSLVSLATPGCGFT